jgi:serine/threonine protein kinase
MSSRLELNYRITAGQMITGKWSGKKFVFRRLLGQGANGQVYEVECNGQVYALKMGSSMIDLQSEINHLQQLTQTQGSPLESYFLLADDGEIGNEWFPFYVMRYIEGERLSAQMLKSISRFEMYCIGKQILNWIGFIHRQGFAFGDLKPDNILVTASKKVFLIDFGGVTPFGSSVKEFTDEYDRGFWGAGGRKADATYDLFSFAMIWVQLLSNVPLAKHPHSPARLYDIIHKSEGLLGMSPFLQQLLQGKVSDTEEAQLGWRKVTVSILTSVDSNLPNYGRWISYLFAFSIVLCAVTVWWASGGS